MKANELQIGDWYRWYADGKYYYYQVKAEDFTKDYIENFEPIPLTEEILEKNGWSEYFFGDEKPIINFSQRFFRKGNDKRLQISLINGDKCFCTNFSLGRIDFHYVHELQQALRICGLKELANNFKIE